MAIRMMFVLPALACVGLLLAGESVYAQKGGDGKGGGGGGGKPGGPGPGMKPPGGGGGGVKPTPPGPSRPIYRPGPGIYSGRYYGPGIYSPGIGLGFYDPWYYDRWYTPYPYAYSYYDPPTVR